MGCQLSRRLGLAGRFFLLFSPSMAGDKEINAARPACSCVIDQGFVHLLGPQRTRVGVLHTHTHTHTDTHTRTHQQLLYRAVRQICHLSLVDQFYLSSL